MPLVTLVTFLSTWGAPRSTESFSRDNHMNDVPSQPCHTRLPPGLTHTQLIALNLPESLHAGQPVLFCSLQWSGSCTLGWLLLRRKAFIQCSHWHLMPDNITWTIHQAHPYTHTNSFQSYRELASWIYWWLAISTVMNSNYWTLSHCWDGQIGELSQKPL